MKSPSNPPSPVECRLQSLAARGVNQWKTFFYIPVATVWGFLAVAVTARVRAYDILHEIS